MFHHEEGISTFPRTRSLKELKSITFDEEEEFSTPKAPYRRKHEIDDLKLSLNRVMYNRESSKDDFIRRPARKVRYDSRRNTTGLTEREIRINQSSKLYITLFLILSLGHDLNCLSRLEDLRQSSNNFDISPDTHWLPLSWGTQLKAITSKHVCAQNYRWNFEFLFDKNMAKLRLDICLFCRVFIYLRLRQTNVWMSTV
jgi:hypothetical protein